jgi:hypothetical protein
LIRVEPEDWAENVAVGKPRNTPTGGAVEGVDQNQTSLYDLDFDEEASKFKSPGS